MVGDWNIIFSYLDKIGGFLWREIIYRNGLLSLMKEFNLVEVYRSFYLILKIYIYEIKNKKLKFRIDFFIIMKYLIN